jgi:hypothetical protein
MINFRWVKYDVSLRQNGFLEIFQDGYEIERHDCISSNKRRPDGRGKVEIVGEARDTASDY